MLKHPKKVVFLDRDGVINEDSGYECRIAKFKFLRNVFRAARTIKQLNYELIIVTNQSGIARGLFAEQDYEYLKKWVHLQFYVHGASVLAEYHCPHHLTESILPQYAVECSCRKPKNGMLLKAQSEYQIDFSRSILIGDSETDIEAGKSVNLYKTFLLTEQTAAMNHKTRADVVCESWLEVEQEFLRLSRAGTLCD